ncbi:MAG: deoxyribonuclease IV [Pirellulaceae bacterium]|nr:deoxyribonuclease IV [Pirellulaceae bacterium]
MSIAGGYHLAVERAQAAGCQCLQIFTKNNNQWRAKPITQEQAERFRQAVQGSSIRATLAHDSYLINLASPDRVLWKRSVNGFIEELQRADSLGIPFVVTHPGAHTTASAERGLRNVVLAIDEIHRRTGDLKAQCLLETTAGQGTALGWRFEQLAAILDRVQQPDRLGICFDTCHVFAAGYPLAEKKDYRATIRQFDRSVGIERIRAFHLNDSLRELGSRVDRHAHIGRGKIGLAAFRNLLADRRFRGVPMYLETPKGKEHGQDLDRINLETLRGLNGPDPRPAGPLASS